MFHVVCVATYQKGGKIHSTYSDSLYQVISLMVNNKYYNNILHTIILLIKNKKKMGSFIP